MIVASNSVMTTNITSRVRRTPRLLILFACTFGLTACSSDTDGHTVATAVPYKSIRSKNERILLAPDIEVGRAGWCVLIPGRESSCGAGRITVPILEEGWSGSAPPRATEGFALTTGEVASVSVDGGPRIPTRSERGLPYGLRAVAVELPGYELKLTRHRRRAVAFTPLTARSQRIPHRVTRLRLAAFEIPTQQVEEPAHLAMGACRIEQAPALASVVATQAVALVHMARSIGWGAVAVCEHNVSDGRHADCGDVVGGRSASWLRTRSFASCPAGSRTSRDSAWSCRRTGHRRRRNRRPTGSWSVVGREQGQESPAASCPA